MKIYEVGSGQQYQEGIEAIALINYIIPLADNKTYNMAKQCYDELINVWHLWQIPF